MVVTRSCVAINEEKCIAVDLVIAFPSDGKTGIGFLEGQFLRIAEVR